MQSPAAASDQTAQVRKSVSLNLDNVLEPVAFRSVKLAQLGGRTGRATVAGKLPAPPRKPSKQHVEDSPQGSAESNLGLPTSFEPTREFYDTQEVFGLTFPRKIQASA